MTRLEQTIIAAVRGGCWSVSSHADERLSERGMETWQIITGFDGGLTIAVEPGARPNPRILRRQTLPDGTDVVVVWAYDQTP